MSSHPPEYGTSTKELLDLIPKEYENKFGDYGVLDKIHEYTENLMPFSFYEDLVSIVLFGTYANYLKNIYFNITPEFIIDVDNMLLDYIWIIKEMIGFQDNAKSSPAKRLLKATNAVVKKYFFVNGGIFELSYENLILMLKLFTLYDEDILKITPEYEY